MKIKSVTRVFVLAGCLLPLAGFTEDLPTLQSELGAISQTDPADAVLAYDQFPPTAAGPMETQASAGDDMKGPDWMEYWPPTDKQGGAAAPARRNHAARQ